MFVGHTVVCPTNIRHSLLHHITHYIPQTLHKHFSYLSVRFVWCDQVDGTSFLAEHSLGVSHPRCVELVASSEDQSHCTTTPDVLKARWSHTCTLFIGDY